jgi:hypothetical protein
VATDSRISGIAWREKATYLRRMTYLRRIQRNPNSPLSRPVVRLPMQQPANRDDPTSPQKSKSIHLPCVGAGSSILPPFATHLLK